MLGNLGVTEIVILLMVLLLVFGARRIPEIGSSLGKGIKEFKKSLRDVVEDEPAQTPPTHSSSSLPSSEKTDDAPKRLSQ